MASLNSNMSPDILVDNLEELLSREEKQQQHVYAEEQQLPLSNTWTVPSNYNVEEKILEEKMEMVDTNNFHVTSTKTKRRRRIDGAWQVWETRCRNVVDDIWRHEDAYPFHHPVDSQQYPDYYEIIDRPMCLEKIQDNLVLGVYASPTEFHNDVMLIFSNSRIYNEDPTSTISLMTKQLEAFYQFKVKTILMDWKLNPEKLQLPDNTQSNNNNNNGDHKKDKKQVQTGVGANGNNFYGRNNKLPKRKKGTNNNRKANGDQHFARRSVVKTVEEKFETPTSEYYENPATNPFTAEKLKAADASLLTKHVNGRKLYACLICHKSLTMQRNARLHVLRVHFRMRMPCLKCGQKFYDYKVLGIHLRKCSKLPSDCNGGQGGGMVPKKLDMNLSVGASAQNNLNVIQKKQIEKEKLKKLRLERNRIRKLAATTVVTNPCKNFNLIRALSVKVMVVRLHIGGFRDNDHVPHRKAKKGKKRLKARRDTSNGCDDDNDGDNDDDDSSIYLVNGNGMDYGVLTPSINSNLGQTTTTAAVPLYEKNYPYYDNNYDYGGGTQFGPFTTATATPFDMTCSTPPTSYSGVNIIPPQQSAQPPRSSRLLVDDPSKSIVDLILHNLVDDDPQPMTTTVVNVSQPDFVDLDSYYGYGQQQQQQQQQMQMQVPMNDQYLSEFLPAPNQYDYSYPYSNSY